MGREESLSPVAPFVSCVCDEQLCVNDRQWQPHHLDRPFLYGGSRVIPRAIWSLLAEFVQSLAEQVERRATLIPKTSRVVESA